MTPDSLPLTAVSLSALLASIGYFWKLLRESKCNIRRVLYFVLEIRHSLIVSTIDSEALCDEYLDLYLKQCASKGVPIDHLPDGIRDLVANNLERIKEIARSAIHDRLLNQYETELLALAGTNPTLAHRLLGRHKIEPLAVSTASASRQALEIGLEIIKEPWAQDFMKSLTRKLQEDAAVELLSILDRDVLLLARRSGPLELYRCARLLRRTRKVVSREILSDLDSITDSPTFPRFQ